MAKPRVAGSYGRRRYKTGSRAGLLARRRRRVRALPKGGFTIRRKCPLITIKGTAVAGVPTATDPTGTPSLVLKLGSTSASGSGFTGLYDIPFALEFKLQDVAHPTEITALCDRYKISNVQLTWHGYNGFVTTATSFIPNTYIEYCTDFDDSAPQAIADFDDRMGIKTKGFNQKAMLSMSVRPRIAMPGDSYYVVPSKSMFIDSAYGNAPHYGIKGVIRNVLLSTALLSNSLGLRATYTVIARDLM